MFDISIVLIYINAGNQHGMGHFTRSHKLGLFLKQNGHTVLFSGSISSYCQTIIKRDFQIVDYGPSNIDVCIIDAITISDDFDAYIGDKDTVILISPTSDFQHKVSHICSRAPLSEETYKKNVEVCIDPYFSFWGCGNFRKPNYKVHEKINLGICISGSHQYVDVSKLVSLLSAQQNVGDIKVLSPGSKFSFNDCQKVTFKESFSDKVWDFFSDIDVFVTGDGITLYEAITMGLPTISLTREGNVNKNAFFESDLFFAVYENEWYGPRLVDIILNKDALKSLKISIEKSNISQKHENLGFCILDIITRNQTVE